MRPRQHLSDLSPEQRAMLRDAMLPNLHDAFVQAHAKRDVAGNLAEAAKQWTRDMDALLVAQDISWVPIWTPDQPIPPEFMVVRDRDDGTARPALVNANPGVTVPTILQEPQVVRLSRGPSPHGPFFALLSDLDATFSAAAGGVLPDDYQAAAAPIAWCWFAWVAQQADDFEVSHQRAPKEDDAFARIGLAALADGCLQLLVETKSTSVHSLRQRPDGTWIGWREVNPHLPLAVAALGPGGCMYVAGVFTTATTVYAQAPAYSPDWDDGTSLRLAPASLDSIALAATADGRLEVFAITQGGLVCNWQDWAGGPFGKWGYVGGAGITRPSLSLLCAVDKVLEVLHIGSDGRVWILRQATDGYCENPVPIGAADPEQPVQQVQAVRNFDGFATVFALTSKGELRVSEQSGSWTWSEFYCIAYNVRKAWACSNRNGAPEVFYVGSDGKLGHQWQFGRGSRSWRGEFVFWDAPDVANVAACAGGDGRMNVIIQRGPDALYRTAQVVPGDATAYAPVTVFY